MKSSTIERVVVVVAVVGEHVKCALDGLNTCPVSPIASQPFGLPRQTLVFTLGHVATVSAVSFSGSGGSTPPGHFPSLLRQNSYVTCSGGARILSLTPTRRGT